MQRLWPLTCPPLKRLRKWQEALSLSPPCVCVCVFVMSHVCDDLKPPGTPGKNIYPFPIASYLKASLFISYNASGGCM